MASLPPLAFRLTAELVQKLDLKEGENTVIAAVVDGKVASVFRAVEGEQDC
jgi:predicted DNA-binding antitoxin AbrB/MazE fold protein